MLALGNLSNPSIFLLLSARSVNSCICFFLKLSLATYSYTSVVTFGGYQDDFMLVIHDDVSAEAEKTGRHLFAMTKGKVSTNVSFLLQRDFI